MIRNHRWLYGILILISLASPLSAVAETLQQAWDVALGANHGLKAAQESTVAAAKRLEAAKAARLPRVSLAAGYTALENTPAIRTSIGGPPIEFPIADRESLSYQAMATLPLYTNGQISSGIDAADAAFNASRTQESGRTQDLKLIVAESFVGVLRAIRGLDVANSRVVSLKAHTQDVENMYEQGMVSRNDLLAAQVALAKNTLDIARSAYNRVLGRMLYQIVALDDLQPELFVEPVEVLTERALRQRHALIALQDQILSLNHQAAAIRAETGPQIALSGGYDFQENQYQVYEGQWLINLGLQWKIFDGGVSRHKASATQQRAMALQEQYYELVTQVALQVRQYWLDVQETRERIPVTEKAIAQAEENLRVNRDRYENGLSTNTEVLDAATLRTRTQNNHANAIYDAVLATLRLKWSVSEL